MESLSQCSKIFFDRESLLLKRELDVVKHELTKITQPPPFALFNNCTLCVFFSYVEKLVNSNGAQCEYKGSDACAKLRDGCEGLLSSVEFTADIRNHSWERTVFERAEAALEFCAPSLLREKRAETQFLRLAVFRTCWYIVVSSFFHHNSVMKHLTHPDATEADWASHGVTEIEMRYTKCMYCTLKNTSKLIIFEPGEII